MQPVACRELWCEHLQRRHRYIQTDRLGGASRVNAAIGDSGDIPAFVRVKIEVWEHGETGQFRVGVWIRFYQHKIAHFSQRQNIIIHQDRAATPKIVKGPLLRAGQQINALKLGIWAIVEPRAELAVKKALVGDGCHPMRF